MPSQLQSDVVGRVWPQGARPGLHPLSHKAWSANWPKALESALYINQVEGHCRGRRGCSCSGVFLNGWDGLFSTGKKLCDWAVEEAFVRLRRAKDTKINMSLRAKESRAKGHAERVSAGKLSHECMHSMVWNLGKTVREWRGSCSLCSLRYSVTSCVTVPHPDLRQSWPEMLNEQPILSAQVLSWGPNMVIFLETISALSYLMQ